MTYFSVVWVLVRFILIRVFIQKMVILFLCICMIHLILEVVFLIKVWIWALLWPFCLELISIWSCYVITRRKEEMNIIDCITCFYGEHCVRHGCATPNCDEAIDFNCFTFKVLNCGANCFGRLSVVQLFWQILRGAWLLLFFFYQILFLLIFWIVNFMLFSMSCTL